MNEPLPYGTKILQSMVNGKIPKPTMAETMNATLVKVQPGFVCFECMASDAHLNPMQGVHGGFAATMLDSATGCAVHSLIEENESYATVELSVKMMRPVPKNKKLYCEGRILNRSKSLGVSEAKLVDESGKLYAHATCTCMIIKMNN